MAFKDTTKNLKDLLHEITGDLQKAENGNKAASQRVRTGTVKLEKVAKLYRKESIKSEKQTKGTRKAPKKAAPKSKGKSLPKKTSKAFAKPRAMSFRRPTAKLPFKKASFR